MLGFLEPFSGRGDFILRLIIAIVFIYHGLPKLTRAGAMAAMVGMPAMMIRAMGVVEVAAALGLVFGLFMEWSALALAVIMLGAIYFKISKWRTGFASQSGTGWEFDLVILGGLLKLLLG